MSDDLKYDSESNISPPSNTSPNYDKTADQKTLDDYYAFFTGQDVDMLPYVYEQPSDSYSNLVQNCPDYYVFYDEVATIRHNKDKLLKYLNNIVNIIEIGPGCDYVIERKTLPILNYAKNLKRYYAVDHSVNYLKEACAFIKSHASGIEIYSVEADLMNGVIKIPQYSGKKCLIFLGSTLGNFTNIQQQYILKQLAHTLDSGDILILTADTNKDPESVVKAYSGDKFTDFARCSLWHFAMINPAFREHVMSLEIKHKWNQEESFLDRYFVASYNISFECKGFGTISIPKGRELRGIKSRKSSVEEMTHLLKSDFDVLDIISYSNKMKTFICQKI